MMYYCTSCIPPAVFFFTSAADRKARQSTAKHDRSQVVCCHAIVRVWRMSDSMGHSRHLRYVFIRLISLLLVSNDQSTFNAHVGLATILAIIL